MPPALYPRLSLGDFGRHLRGSQAMLTGQHTGPMGLFTPYLLADLVTKVLTQLHRPSRLWEDLECIEKQRLTIEADLQSLRDPTLERVVGYHQLPHGFTFYGVNLVGSHGPDRFAVIYSTAQGEWRAKVFDPGEPTGPGRVTELLDAIERAFPAPANLAANALDPVSGLFMPMTAMELAQRMHIELPDEEEASSISLRNDDQVAHALARHRLPPLASHSPIIAFDTENVIGHRQSLKNHLIGFHELGQGFSFWGGEAGGDWQWPVFFLIYVDGQGALRTYVPAQGNTYDPDTMEAYDNDDFEELNLESSPQFSHDLMQQEIERAFGLSTTGAAVQPPDLQRLNPHDAAKRLLAILSNAPGEYQATRPSIPPAVPTSTPKAAGKISTEDCKALLEQHPAVAAMGLAGPWKRLSKKGNAQAGVVRIFEGKQGWAKLLEKDGQLTLIALSIEPLP